MQLTKYFPAVEEDGLTPSASKDAKATQTKSSGKLRANVAAKSYKNARVQH
jgi:hypothetical protein